MTETAMTRCGAPSGYHDDGDPMVCTLPAGHRCDHAHHHDFTWPEGRSALELSAALPEIGSRLRFDGKRTSWRVRAHAGMGRYTICTAWFGLHPRTKERQVAYTIIDWHQQIRGAMNVIGGGLGIDTLDGPDPDLDEAVRMLDEGVLFEIEAQEDHSIPSGGWGVSHRNQVPLRITVGGA